MAEGSANNSRIIAERTRTIDQIKRLYAILMGLSATECIKNISKCLDYLNHDSLAYFILLSYGLIFFSLAMLFFLGAERHLDSKYLSETSPKPSRAFLAFDIAALFFSATMFFVIAESIPVKEFENLRTANALNGNILDIFSVGKSRFVNNLIFMAAADVIILTIQITFLAIAQKNKMIYRVMRAYGIWIGIDALSGLALFLFVKDKTDQYIYGCSLLTIFIVSIFLLRFIADYCSTFDLYYPPSRLGLKGTRGYLTRRRERRGS